MVRHSLVRVRGLAMVALALALVPACSTFMLSEKPKTPIERYIVAQADFNAAQAEALIWVEGLAARAEAGDASALELLPIAEVVAHISQQAAGVTKVIHDDTARCYGVDSVGDVPGEEVIPTTGCDQWTSRLILATGQVAALKTQLLAQLTVGQRELKEPTQ